jgi:hypothetical protein
MDRTPYTDYLARCVQAGVISAADTRSRDVLAQMHAWQEERLSSRTAHGMAAAVPVSPGKEMMKPGKEKGADMAIRTAVSTASRVVPAGRIPDGVHLVPGPKRIGDAAREAACDHLSHMFTGGYIPQEEFEARVNAVMEAVTQPELDLLVSDLPGRRPPALPAKAGPPGNPMLTNLIVIVAGFVLMMTVALVSLMTRDLVFGIPCTVGAVAFLVIAGILGTVQE